MDKANIENIALISIHPQYGHAILEGEKLVEFRKVKFRKPVEYCLMYSTSPEQKIIGFFKIKKIVEDSPKNLWMKFSSVGKIDKKDFLNYYSNTDSGVAIVIERAWELKETYNLCTFKNDFSIPQSFMYLNEEFYETFKFTFLRHLSLYKKSLFKELVHA